MAKKVLGRSPWRWAILVVGLFFTAAPIFMMFPWKAWYLGTVPDALITVVLPVVILLFGLWIVITALRSGLVLDGDHLVNIPYMGLPRKARIADIAGIGAEFGHNFAAPTVRMSDGATFLLTGVAYSPTEHGYFPLTCPCATDRQRARGPFRRDQPRDVEAEPIRPAPSPPSL